MSSNCKFWPLDDDSEGEIYDNLAWDLPGFRVRKNQPRRNRPASRSIVGKNSY
jgi:hypothetical protein